MMRGLEAVGVAERAERSDDPVLTPSVDSCVHGEIQFLSRFIWHLVNGNRFQSVSVSMGFTKCQIKQHRNCISL